MKHKTERKALKQALSSLCLILLSLMLCACSNTSTSTSTTTTAAADSSQQSAETESQKQEQEEQAETEKESQDTDTNTNTDKSGEADEMSQNEKLEAMYDEIKDRLPFQPELGIVLDSGLGNYAADLEVEAVIPYEDIPGFPASSVEGHEGQYVFAKVDGVPVVLMQGRVHLYEGYEAGEVVTPIRLMGKMGISDLLLTNAAEGMADDLNPGDLMIITDQISSAVENPLIGPDEPELGERFPAMNDLYNKELIELIHSASEKSGVPVKEGIYIQLSGPSYETPAEINMYKNFGDAIGLSTAIEAIAAHHMGIHVAGISCITNKAAGLAETSPSHDEVLETSIQAAEDFETLVNQFIQSYKFYKAAS